MNNTFLDDIIFKIISLITYNNNCFKSLYIENNELIINISKLKILELKDLNFNDNIIEIYNKIYQDYELIQNYNDVIINNNNSPVRQSGTETTELIRVNQKINTVDNYIIFINLENINDMYLELLEYFSKKN
jgi:CRISPR/Cas system CMR subunit Cmr4 (Cas7 group RAMP superfamily)